MFNHGNNASRERLSADTRNENYAGTLRRAGDYRLIVVGTGLRFDLQLRVPAYGFGVQYRTVRHSKTLSALVAKFPEGVAFDDLSALPDDPSKVPRPWARREGVSMAWPPKG